MDERKSGVDMLEEWMLDWDWEENEKIDLNPESVTIGSRKRVSWKCHVCNGRWNTVLKERRGCPYCTGFKALSGFNDLATTHPWLIKEWDYDKNKTITPQDVTKGSQKKVFWRCEKNHSWEMQINSRVQGQGCPYCNNRRVLQGYNDLRTVNPKLAEEWHPTKNGERKPSDVVAGSKERVWWICAKGHEWRSSVSYEVASGKCPYCTGMRVLEGFNDLATINLKLAKEWDVEKNGDTTPSTVTAGSGIKAWWKCEKGHSWKASVVSRNRGNGCPICANRILLKGYNDVASQPQLLLDWNYEQNGELKPDEVCIGKERKVWWICSTCKHQWEATVISRTAGRGCPKCAEEERVRARRETLLKKKSPITITHPEIAEEWNIDKNGELFPDTITAGSGKYVWWKCKICGNEWNGRVCERTRGRAKCRNCQKGST